jgi:hypothetical protein
MAPQPEGWLYRKRGDDAAQPHGYFSDQDILIEVSQGRLDAQCEVTHPQHTQGDWRPASRIKAFHQRFHLGRQYLVDASLAEAEAARREQADRAIRRQLDHAAAERVLRELEDENMHSSSLDKKPAEPKNLVMPLLDLRWLVSAKDPPRPAWEAVKEAAWRTWPVVTILLGLFFWAAFASVWQGALSLICYPAIALIGATLVSLWFLPFRRRSATLIGWGLVIAAILWWGYRDTYVVEWSQGSAEYHDTFSRWTRKHLHRRVEAFSSTDRDYEDRIYDANGPVGQSGKPHGRWSYYYDADHVHPAERFQTKFYWYGEEISEGEWHLRNR